jgi:hypothetical protein
MPASPSITTQSSWRTSRLASRAPTTAGMSMLRATIAVWEVRPHIGDEAGEQAALELQHVCRRDVVGHQHQGSSPA